MGRNNLISNKDNFVRTADEKLYTFNINYYICSYAPPGHSQYSFYVPNFAIIKTLHIDSPDYSKKICSFELFQFPPHIFDCTTGFNRIY